MAIRLSKYFWSLCIFNNQMTSLFITDLVPPPFLLFVASKVSVSLAHNFFFLISLSHITWFSLFIFTEMKPGKSSGASTEEMLPAKNTGCNRDHKRHILGYTRRTEKEVLERNAKFSLDGFIIFMKSY